MPVEEASGANRASVTHLEALGRLAAGIAPWLELAADDTAEGRQRARYAELTRRAIDRAVDPASKDFLNFTKGGQPLVDAAFLAQGVLRAPRALAGALEPATRRHLIAALESTRVIQPGFNNWLLFSATVEAALAKLGVAWDRMRVDYALRQHDQWYKGDGAYGDGPEFHWDYYNSFVIHPMLLDVLDALGAEHAAWKDLAAREAKRAQRYAAVLERLIAPDGTFPPIGRSLAYRVRRAAAARADGAAQGAARRRHPGADPRRSDRRDPPVDGGPEHVRRRWLAADRVLRPPARRRRALHLDRQRLSVRGRPAAARARADRQFWAAPPQPWTSVLAWSGQPFPIDHAL